MLLEKDEELVLGKVLGWIAKFLMGSRNTCGLWSRQRRELGGRLQKQGEKGEVAEAGSTRKRKLCGKLG